MTRFPSAPFDHAGDYFDAYARELSRALATVDREAIHRAAAALADATARQARIFTCGNGGSASISNHFVCDHTKGVRTDTTIKPCIHSLVSNVEITTAIANDIAYDDVFSYQLESYGRPGDVLVAISSSGRSPNIIKVLKEAKCLGLTTLVMTGFTGGDARALADIALHVDSTNYGVVEDAHQSLMHVLAQYIRQAHFADRSLIGAKAF